MRGYPPSRAGPGRLASGFANNVATRNLGSSRAFLGNVRFPPFLKSAIVTSSLSATTSHRQSALVSSLYQRGSSPQVSSHSRWTLSSTSSNSQSSSAIGSCSIMETFLRNTSAFSFLAANLSILVKLTAPVLTAGLGGLIELSLGQLCCSWPTS
jgi:hypothetical protein